MTSLSSAGPVSTGDAHPIAHAVHDLGSALWFGGAVMGIAGVNKSGADLKEGIDRIRVAGSAWSRFGPVEWAGIVATLGADIRLGSVAKKRLAYQRGYGTLTTVKAVVATLALASTAYATYTGRKVGQAAEAAHRRGETIDVVDASLATDSTPEELAKWQKRQRVSQYLVPLFAGANITVASYIAQANRPSATVKGVIGRLLPV